MNGATRRILTGFTAALLSALPAFTTLPATAAEGGAASP